MKTLTELFEKFDAMPLPEQAYWVFRFVYESVEKIERTEKFHRWAESAGVVDFISSYEFDLIRVQVLKDCGAPANKLDSAIRTANERKPAN